MTDGGFRDPELALALAYAPAASRAALETLFRLDERLGAIVAEPNAPIAAIKLAWWREALARLDSAPPPAEPLLGAIAGQLLPAGVKGADLAAIGDGWDALIEADEDDATAVLTHAVARGVGVFRAAAALLRGEGAADLALAGEFWALATLTGPFAATARALAHARQGSIPALRWPRRLRTLGVLVLLARDRVQRPGSRAGSPRRVARALWHGISGR